MSNSVARRIVDKLIDQAAEVGVAEVRIGLGYTAVMLSDRRTGLAYTFRDEAQRGCSVLDVARPLRACSTAELLALLESLDAIEAGIGLACANALANRDGAPYLDGDILDHLDLRPDDRVAMVGNFRPVVAKLEDRVRSLTVFERVEKASGSLRPQAEAATVLPGCDVALITATSIENHTIDALLQVSRPCREVALLGASTPLAAEVFAENTPVTLLSGIVVNSPDDILRVVSEGGGTRHFGPYSRKVTLRVGTVPVKC